MTRSKLARAPARGKFGLYVSFKSVYLMMTSNGKTPATASEPVGKPKSGKDLAVEDLAEYYANSKPPGRRYPPSMASNMLMSYVDGDMPDLPIIKDAGKKRESDEGEK